MKMMAAANTMPNQMTSAMPVRAAALSIFGSGARRSRIGVGLVRTSVAGALTARSLARKAKNSHSEIYFFTATCPAD